MDKNNILEVKDLTVNFSTHSGTVQAVRGVSFEVKKGETLAIVGESGSGKSVTMKTVMQLLAKNAKVESGEILYNGKNLLELSEKEMCRIRGQEIAMVFQDPLSSLDPLMKVGKQITETLVLNKTVSRREARKLALELMEKVGIEQAEKRIDQYPFQFSGGMRQRMVIATALAQKPRLLICDEPTTALDVTIQAQVLELIAELQQKEDLSVVFITHDLGVVANVADRICVMYAGKIVEYGTAEEIFYDPRHPYTWGLMRALPAFAGKDGLNAIPGMPPTLIDPPRGDAFACRNEYALGIDYEEMPPMFRVSDTHFAATWLLDERAPRIEPPVGRRSADA